MKIRLFVMMCCCLGAAVFAKSLSTKEIMALPYEVLAEIPDIKFEEKNDTKEFILPSMPVKPGKIRVLRGRFVSYAKDLAGCNKAMKIEVNGVPMGRVTAAGDERMLCKNASYVLTGGSYKDREFGYFSGTNIELPFAPDVDYLDANTVDNNGSMFMLDLEDVAFSVDGNSVRITNIRNHYMDFPITLFGQEISIGYLDKSALPAPPGSDVTYDGVEKSVTLNGIRLDVGKAGGFAIAGEKGDIYLVESKLSMPFATPFELNASDEKSENGPEVSVEASGKYGFIVRAKWNNGVELYRRLTVEQDGLVHWLDDWKNGSNAIIGVPFHHRVRLVGGATRTIIAGNGDSANISSPDMNPTITIINRGDNSGIGISEDNDFARLLGSVKAANEGTEIYSANFALAPGCSQPMNYSIDIFANGGYWKYINRLRKRWHIGKVTAPYPFFFSPRYQNAPGATNAEKIKNAFAHLGTIGVGVTPWRRHDHSFVRAGLYPKLAEGEEPTVGGTPDVDIEEFVTFNHRKEFDKAVENELKLFRENAPNVKYIAPTHPAMETVYLPLADRWPYAENAIHDINGVVFHNAHYDRSHLGDYVAKGWAVGYYAPYGGTRYYDILVDDIRRCIDMGVDGIYIDELSFGLHRDYSRYDYGRWDGFSADLDENGKVVRLKYDVALASEGLQNAAISMTKEKGLFFLGNGSASLRSVNNSQALRFWEGGNGASTLAYSHLSHVPLAFGNYGDITTLAGVLDCVKEALRAGCIYSPTSCNLVLKDPVNCVCKLYPITVDEIYPGLIIGKERLITINSGTFEWACAPEGAKVELFVFGVDGERIPNEGDAPVVKDGKITIEVPKGGLVIAELVLN